MGDDLEHNYTFDAGNSDIVYTDFGIILMYDYTL